MTVQHYSHIGKKARQEDCIALSSDQRLYILCDGVGGLENGDIASETVCRAVISAYEQDQDNFRHKDISKLIIKAQRVLLDCALRNPEHRDMSTTYILVYIHKNKASISHMGDSKAIIMSPEDGLLWSSRDDSVVQELYEDGIISVESDILTHPLRNRITKMLQAKPFSTLPNQNITLKIKLPKDYIILMGSDGVFENYTTEQVVDHFLNRDITVESRWQLFKDYCMGTSVDNNSGVVIMG